MSSYSNVEKMVSFYESQGSTTPHDEWRKKNETLRIKYNIPNQLGQTWNCLPGCQSGCYRGCDNTCWSCYIMQDIQKIMN